MPDEDGASYCQSVGLRIGIENGKVWVEDTETGQDLLTHLATQQALRVAEARVAELEAQLRAIHGEQANAIFQQLSNPNKPAHHWHKGAGLFFIFLAFIDLQSCMVHYLLALPTQRSLLVR